jgi:hypothetical protein
VVGMVLEQVAAGTERVCLLASHGKDSDWSGDCSNWWCSDRAKCRERANASTVAGEFRLDDRIRGGVGEESGECS